MDMTPCLKTKNTRTYTQQGHTTAAKKPKKKIK